MAEEVDYKKLYEQEKKKTEALSKKLSLYEDDPVKSGYFVLVYIQNQQIEFLRNFKIKDEVGKLAKEDATYARAKDMWEGLSKMIESITQLKTVLKISPEEEKIQMKRMVSPESIAQDLGDYKTQDV